MKTALKIFFFILYWTNESTSFLQGVDIRITCSVPGSWPSWTKDGIAISHEGSSLISPAFPRIEYEEDQSTLRLTKAELADAGAYTCSFVGGQSATFIVNVDVALITGSGCPDEDSGFASITSTCVTMDIQTECKYIFKDYKDQKKKVCGYKTAPNSTGCIVGKSQETGSFKYTKSEFLGKLRVNIMCSLVHTSSGGTVLNSETCTQDYYIDPCCEGLQIGGYVVCTLPLGISLINVIIIFYLKICNDSEWQEKSRWIKLIVLQIVIFLGCVIWVIIEEKIVLPIFPDGELDNCCICTGPEAFLGTMDVFTIVLLFELVWLIFLVEKNTNKNHAPVITGLTF